LLDLINNLPIGKIMLASFFAILFKILASPAMLAALVAFLQKTLHP
jgi:hypothetical protein